VFGTLSARTGGRRDVAVVCGGLQAPRMRWGARSASSLVFMVAWTSIPVRTPNPCAARSAHRRDDLVEWLIQGDRGAVAHDWVIVWQALAVA
jgi:hypothetical protein